MDATRNPAASPQSLLKNEEVSESNLEVVINAGSGDQCWGLRV